MNLTKFSYAYSRHGLVGFINVLFGKLGFKFRMNTPLDRIIFYHGKKIENLSKYKNQEKYIKFVKELNGRIKAIEEKLEDIQGDKNYPLKIFKCESCGYEEDFYFNDAITIYQKFHAHLLKK